ncbi:MAG: cation diffusion facilitator family transporter [Candidatus Nanopelagicales bacterium]
MSSTTSTAGGELTDLSKYGVLSLVVGFVVLALKLGAWWVTGSVGLLSDGLESLVNIAAASVAIVALRTASRPPDAVHQFGHGKAEYFSALVEGAMIVVAATMIIISAVGRFLNPQPLEQVGLGLAISVVASLLNAAVALVLFRVGKDHGSQALIADAHHLVTDLWTTGGVLIAVIVVSLTGWERLDPIIALAVAVNIIFVGVRLLRRSTAGLMDAALPDDEMASVRTVLREYQGDDVVIHGLQTRQAGRQRFVSMHVLVPGSWSVTKGHDLCDDIESDVRELLPGTVCLTHLEPLEDPRAWADLHDGHQDV